MNGFSHAGFVILITSDGMGMIHVRIPERSGTTDSGRAILRMPAGRGSVRISGLRCRGVRAVAQASAASFSASDALRMNRWFAVSVADLTAHPKSTPKVRKAQALMPSGSYSC